MPRFKYRETSRAKKMPEAKTILQQAALVPASGCSEANVTRSSVEKVALAPTLPVEPAGTPFDLSKEKTITVKEAAYRLRKSQDAIYLWLRNGRLRGWQPGGRGCAVLVAEESVEEALLCHVGK